MTILIHRTWWDSKNNTIMLVLLPFWTEKGEKKKKRNHQMSELIPHCNARLQATCSNHWATEFLFTNKEENAIIMSEPHFLPIMFPDCKHEAVTVLLPTLQGWTSHHTVNDIDYRLYILIMSKCPHEYFMWHTHCHQMVVGDVWIFNIVMHEAEIWKSRDQTNPLAGFLSHIFRVMGIFSSPLSNGRSCKYTYLQQVRYQTRSVSIHQSDTNIFLQF